MNETAEVGTLLKRLCELEPDTFAGENSWRAAWLTWELAGYCLERMQERFIEVRDVFWTATEKDYTPTALEEAEFEALRDFFAGNTALGLTPTVILKGYIKWLEAKTQGSTKGSGEK